MAPYASAYSYFYSDSWQLIEQREGQYQGPERQFVWGLRYLDDIVLRDSGDYNPTRLYALQDANWNVSALVDTTGAVRERYAYDTYGQVTFMFADFSLTSGGTGYYSQFDWETLFAGLPLLVRRYALSRPQPLAGFASGKVDNERSNRVQRA